MNKYNSILNTINQRKDGLIQFFIIPLLIDSDKISILGNNESSGIVLPDEKKFRMYTMHRKINIYLPK
jgi:hypothetical protein